MTVIGARTTGGVVEIRVTSGGAGYTTPPSVTIGGNAAVTASATAMLAGTRVESLILSNPGAGYTSGPTVSFSGGGGTGAAATALRHTGSLRPMSFFKGRFGTVYGVDGMGRGIRWDGGSTTKPIGLHKPPPPAVVVVAATSESAKRITSIQLIDGGRGYASAPTVSFSGGSGGTGASAQAAILNGAVVGVRVVTGGSGYKVPPTVTLNGGFGASATFTVGVKGKAVGFDVTNRGSSYTSSGSNRATIGVSSGASANLTGFNGIPQINADGELTGVVILSGGTGATGTPTFVIGGGSGANAAVTPRMEYAVDTITTGHSGDGRYMTPPYLTIRPAANDNTGGGAAADLSVSNGFITGATVTAGGAYEQPPSALIVNTAARAQASVSVPQRGKYLCGVRYIAGSDSDVGGSSPSSVSHLVEVNAGDGANNLTWTFSHQYVDDRVTAMELWRTTGDQGVLLFRVATITRTGGTWSAGTYTDTLTDPQLTDSARDGYGLMPLTLPSGQINARRFEVPPGKFAVGAMFQDRAWYAVDTTSTQPNSLYFSEIDEPESVPAANELVVQENTDMPDAIVALVPLGSSLLIAQSNHIYRLTYVAQPVLDASIMLVANRGVLHNRCWAVMAGVAFFVDSVGMYAFDGSQEQSISVSVDNYWREGVIDFNQADKFHVDADYLTRTVRFYYCIATDTQPSRALCYCTATQAWWEEQYATPVTAATGVTMSGQFKRVLGLSSGAWRKESGNLDTAAGVQYSLRTGNMALKNEPDRAIDILYKPTANDSTLNVALHYNNSPTARSNAIQSDRGTGFTVTANGPAALNLKKTRSALGDATGSAMAHFSGRKSERSAGGDQHIAIAYSGTQSGTTSGDAVVLYGTRISGAE